METKEGAKKQNGAAIRRRLRFDRAAEHETACQRVVAEIRAVVGLSHDI